MNYFTKHLGLLSLAAITCMSLNAAPQQDQDDESQNIQTALQSGQKVSYTRFNLYPNPKVVACLQDDSGYPPSASVLVVRGNLNDRLFLIGNHIKPGLQFDLFTVEKTALLSNGQPSPTFDGKFGLAWYQSDLEAGRNGRVYAQIETILLDQIFGFDANTGLPPTSTFHVGFWFNNPEDAKACGFDITKPTPFNGEHKAGPLAMISAPDAKTGIGPLCTDPDHSHPGACNP